MNNSVVLSTKSKSLIVEIICFLFILLFVYASLNKLIDVEKFRVQIGQSPLLTGVAPVISWLIPAIEILISLALVSSKFRLAALYASFGLMVGFSLYIIAILNFSEHVPCSCGGVLENMGWTQHLIFNIVFVFLAALGILFYERHSASSVVSV